MAINLADLARKRQQVQRLAPLLGVLARHGFGRIIEVMNLQHLLPSRLRVGLRLGEGAVVRVPIQQRLRMVLEDWGPTAIKLGQMLSLRPDLLPEPYLAELRKLTDRVPPFDTAEARRIIERQLGRPITELFAEFPERPAAAGSISQVYEATLRTGEPVVVKVKRPNVERMMTADLDLLETVAVPLFQWLEDLRPLRPRMLIAEFRRNLARELDFVAEASSTQKIRESLSGLDCVRVPAVHWELTTSDVLTVEHLSGVSLSDRAALKARSADRPALARRLAEIYFHQFFRSGLFHADPHPGNLLMTDDGKIGLVDFGMVGRLDRDLRGLLATSFIAMTRGDVDAIAEVYMEIGAISENTDVAALKADMYELLDKYYGIPVKRLDMRRCFADAMRVARTHDLFLPRDFVMLGKALVTMIAVARELDPTFDLAEVSRPFAASLIADRLSPARIGRDAISGLSSAALTLRRLPREMRAFVRTLLAGKLQFQLLHRAGGFEGIARELDRATNRIAFSIIVGAVVIGSALVLHARVPPYLQDVLPGRLGAFAMQNLPDVSLLGFAGFIFAGVLGLLLAWAIWRHGRL